MNPHSSRLPLGVVLSAFFCLSVGSVSAELFISEFMADNQSGITDQDGEFSDWIEICNSGPDAEPLTGYHLTDDPALLTKWTFPVTTINSNGYLVVFASSKNRAVGGEQLHTNFGVGAGGEYLALVAPDGVTIVSEYAPQFPSQLPDVSYGVGVGGIVTEETLIALGDEAKYFVPAEELVEDWRLPGFDDSLWNTAQTALGWGYPDQPIGATGDISAGFRFVKPGAYLRLPFEITDPAEVLDLTLKVKFEDAFAVYLNGEPVGYGFYPTRNGDPSLIAAVPDPIAFDAIAPESGEVDAADPFKFLVLDFAGHLVAGTNILAIHALNDSAGSSDFLMYPELNGQFVDISQGLIEGYFDEPTPGGPNNTPEGGPPGIDFSQATRTFSGSLAVELFSNTPGATIRYTTNGELPTDAPPNPSAVYGGPIEMSTTTLIRARAFKLGALDGPTRSEAYFSLGADALAHTSDLPIIIVENFGAGTPPDTGSTDRQPVMLAIFEPKGAVDPRASLSNPPDLVARAGVRRRGSSSGGWPKYSMSMETWSENDWEEKSIRPLGFGGEDDWVLNSRYEFDLSLMRNPFIYDMSRQVGRYAARSRFVEMYHNTNGGDLTGNDYFGVYSFMERLDRDDDRINVARLDATIDSEPEITGGYIFKNDRSDPGEPTLSVAGFPRALVHVYPSGGANANRPDSFFITPTQRDWLRDHLNEINDALNRQGGAGVDGIHPTTGLHFSDYIDVESFYDHLWLNTLALNVDWGRLSAWYHMDRGGKLQGGPIWDFDRTMGSTDGRDRSPLTWFVDSGVWYDSEYPWFGKVMGFWSDSANPTSGNPTQSTRPDYFQRAVDRWFELRAAEFTTENIHATIDGMADQLRESQARSFARWSSLPRGNPGTSEGYGAHFYGDGNLDGWELEVSHLKGWLEARAAWIESQFPAAPAFSSEGGLVDEGFGVAMSAPEGTIYFTTDGSDPRAPGGGVAASAFEFSGGAASATALVAADADCTYLVPDDGSLGLSWTEDPDSFDDSSWTPATNGVGFESASSPIFPLLGTNNKADVQPAGVTNSAGFYVRYEFDLPGGSEGVVGLDLSMVWDDAFVAYLNGVKLDTPNSGNNPPASPQWDSPASGSRGTETAVPVEWDIAAYIPDLRTGANVLSVHAMNFGLNSSDLHVRPLLTADIATPFTINESTTVIARTFEGGQQWSGPASVDFIVGTTPADSTNTVVSEIMYNPTDLTAAEIGLGFTNSDQFEWLELMNISDDPVSLLGSMFTDGFDFNFDIADINTLLPGERVLIVRDEAAFAHRHGNAHSDRIAGIFLNNTGLANNGERLELVNIDEQVVRAFTYLDDPPWPNGADGNGFSLVLIAPGTNPDHSDPASWQSSAVTGGSPGFDGGESYSTWAASNGVSDPDSDDDNDLRKAVLEYAVGTNPSSADAALPDIDACLGLVEVGGLVDEYLLLKVNKSLSASDAELLPELSLDGESWSAAGTDLILVEEINRGDGTAQLIYRSALPFDQITDSVQLMRLKVTLR